MQSGYVPAGDRGIRGGRVLHLPADDAVLKLAGRRATLGPGHPMTALAMQVAFTLPLTLRAVVAREAGRT